ncbi:hypothetical protein [Methanolobus halotolerans]|uniref:KaiC protein n=1 Tax=Methanolobus halotolerans TaxID=2052935 RepID=A0A4E0PV24_9EURY|nr:hypothetical protein [Methanolobus halotolerans]TGC07458.1 hypothetical protein CUN85_11220 [Methanolobus halotolerans]
MNNGRKIQLSGDFLKTLEGRNSLFLYGKTKITGNVSDLIIHHCNFFAGAIIHMHLDKSSGIPTELMDRQIIQLPVSKNLTSTMIKLERLVSDKVHLIILDSLEELALEVGMKPCSRFLSVLFRKSREQNRTVLSFYREDTIDANSAQYITRSFDNIFRTDGNNIFKQGSDVRTCDTLPDNKKSTDPHISTEMEKIRDIFRLTPEEQKELDKIVGDRIREFSIS